MSLYYIRLGLTIFAHHRTATGDIVTYSRVASPHSAIFSGLSPWGETYCNRLATTYMFVSSVHVALFGGHARDAEQDSVWRVNAA